MRPKSQLTNFEIWNIISKEYVGTKDIGKIAFVGDSAAQSTRREIEKELINWLLPHGLVPTDYVLKKLNINRDEIFKKAKMEKELE